MNRQGVIFLDRKNKKSFAFSGDLEWSPEADDNKTLLQFALESGMIDVESIRDAKMKSEKKEALRAHQSAIWQNKKGRWLTYIIDTDGERRQVSRSTRADLEKAIWQHWKEQIENPTVSAVFREWNDRKLELGKIKEATHYINRQCYKRFLSDFGRRRIRNVTEDDILTLLEESASKYQLTAKAFSGLKTVIRGIFRYARRKKLTDIDIEQILRCADTTEIRFIRHVHEDCEEVYSEEETDALIDYLSKHQDHINLCILLMFVSGIRVGEAVSLKPEDLGDTYVNIRRTVTHYKSTDGRWVTEVSDKPKTMAGWRTVVIPQKYVWVIEASRKQNAFGKYVFESKKDVPMSVGTIRKRLTAICRRMGIPYRSPHKIRKTYGSILLDNGIDRSIVLQQMGHTSLITTERHYHRNRRTLDERQAVISALPDFERDPMVGFRSKITRFNQGQIGQTVENQGG